jgi:hypothetical protein
MVTTSEANWVVQGCAQGFIRMMLFNLGGKHSCYPLHR